MKKYLHHDEDSGVNAYEFTKNGIKLRFIDGSIYLYDSDSCGQECIEIMKALAEKGIGLTTYINQHVRENYAEKIR